MFRKAHGVEPVRERVVRRRGLPHSIESSWRLRLISVIQLRTQALAGVSEDPALLYIGPVPGIACRWLEFEESLASMQYSIKNNSDPIQRGTNLAPESLIARIGAVPGFIKDLKSKNIGEATT